MTVQELRDYLGEFVGNGKGDMPVGICDENDNPICDWMPIARCIFFEVTDEETGVVVLQME